MAVACLCQYAPCVLRDTGEEGAPVSAWIEHYNLEAPHSALGMRAPAEFYADWLVKNKQLPVQI
jgi:hypothetical protein